MLYMNVYTYIHQRGLNEKRSQILTNLQKSAHDMLTSPSNYVYKELELWKLVLKKYLNGNFSVLKCSWWGNYIHCTYYMYHYPGAQVH